MPTDAPLHEPRSEALRALMDRGFFEQASDLAAIDAALEGQVTFYVGFDPTATSMHVGNLLTIMAMRLLQRHGHRPIALVGGGTAMVGDPSGKTESRRMLDADTIAAQSDEMRRQFGRFVHFDRGTDNDAIMVDNGGWLLELRYVEFLRDIGRHFTVNRMIATKTYRDRLDAEQPLSFLEFNYQLLQAYDFLHLWRTQDCLLQLGGSDQWGNMIAGVELIRRVEGKSAQCLTFPLLTTADGKKMGKTERGAVWLDAEQFPPFDYYQFWVGCDDRDVAKLLRLYTEIPTPEIDQLCAAEGAALREAKRRLAWEATALAHGAAAADTAAQASEQAYGGGGDWSAVPQVALPADASKLVDVLVHPDIGAFTSKRQARQRIEAGAVRLDGEICRDPGHPITPDACRSPGLRLQAGKKTRVRVVAR